jgi:prophage regulatory protein
MKAHENIELWKARKVCQVVSIGRTSLWAKSKSGHFPKPIKTGPGSIAWRSDEVLAWIESRERVR